FALMLRAGIDDWGGVSPVTPDHVNPERPWPHVDTLAEHTRAAGFDLQERLAVYPRYVTATAGQWIDTRLTAHIAALARPDGLADPDAPVVGREWQEPDGGLDTYGRADLNTAIDTEGRTEDRRGDFDSVYGDWASLTVPKAIERLPEDTARALRLAADNPAGILDDTDAAMALLTADGPALETMTRLADELRAEVVGDDVTYVVNRNINFSNVCYVGCRFCAFAQRERDADAFRLSIAEVADRAQEAWDAGATEVCMQGGIDPKLPVTYYADVVRAIKTRVPGMHVHAFSPMEIVAAATKAGVSVREWLTELRAAGLDTIPGTAAEILDDDVRWVLTKGKLPAATWLEVVATAHEVGIRSSSTMMYGHVDHPGHWLGHFRALAALQDRAGGLTEFVGLPFVHRNAPIYLAGVARPGPTRRDNRAVHAFARLALHGRVDNVQCSWVKLGDDGTAEVLRGGANDLGGTLMEETISRMAGSEHGSARTATQLHATAALAGRPARQRTTTYGRVDHPAPAIGGAPTGNTATRKMPV
ncbi:5-amino-6-(D-ribitylamino)uracil--L-tyrosine 4-hydroxyphenyl transferase CofH, partial [Actinosynnema sp. NPDC049800]